MPKSGANISLISYDDIFSTEETRKTEQIQQIPIAELHPFKNHPFKVLDDEAMQRTAESVAQFGVLAPLIARPRPEGGYEIISGHRRQHAAELAGLQTLPVIVRDMSDDEAVIRMVDSNLQREYILPSERAFAYKMKLEAIKNQGARSDLTSRQVGEKLWSVTQVGAAANESERQVHRFIRLTNLIPELLDLVDQRKISFNPAVELSYLTAAEQRDFLEAIQDTQNAPSLSQAQRIKKLSQEGKCSYEAIFDIMGEEKKAEMDRVTIKNEVLRKYFPKSYTPKQMQDTILHAQTDAGHHHQAAGTVAEKAPAQPGALTDWHKSQNTTNKFGGNAYEQNETYPRAADLRESLLHRNHAESASGRQTTCGQYGQTAFPGDRRARRGAGRHPAGGCARPPALL